MLPGKDGGFALILSLSILALTMLTLVLLANQVRLQATSASLSRSQFLAKESAKLGFLIALGNLQRHAGPDQRITARADLFRSDNPALTFASQTDRTNRFWTGIWDTTQEAAYENQTAIPVWLVSGRNSSPTEATDSSDVLLVPGFNPQGTSGYSDPEAFHPVRVEPERVLDSSAQFAWWVGDDGIKASIAVQDDLIREVSSLPEEDSYLDYGPSSARLLRQNHHPTFPYPLLYEYHTASDDELAAIDRILPGSDFRLASSRSLSAEEVATVSANALHDLTIGNRFVLSNPQEGGLKRDLSYLKTMDPALITTTAIEELYGSAAAPLTPEAVEFLSLRYDPVSTQDEPGRPMIFPRSSLTDTRALDSRLWFAPVITEFQLSCGVAAEGGNRPNAESPLSDVFLAYKIYLDIWNPYTAPMRIGDGIGAAEPNSYDLRVEIENLPSVTLTNTNTGDSVSTDLPDISLLWSETHGSSPGKTLRPGMNFHTTLPRDNGGDNESGVFQVPLGIQLSGSRSDDYLGSFAVSGPLEISIHMIANDGSEAELCRARLDNYPNFTVEYFYNSFSNRASWFKRVPESSDGAWGLNHGSLEVVGYAFGFRFRLLDEQESIGTIDDLSRILSQADIRSQLIDVDLSDWDINDAWEGDSPLPYDFTSSPGEIDPGFFDPSHGFLSNDFFHYENTGGGRRDRVARVYEVPAVEVSSIHSLRNVSFKGYPTMAIGSPWGGELNGFFDTFFLSTLPDPSVTEWDGEQPLRNPKIVKSGEIPTLTTPLTARGLMIQNGFNVNSTSPVAWTSVLTGRSFLSDEFSFRYEKPDSSKWQDPPPWGTVSEPLENLLFTLPETASFNLVEQPDGPRYTLITMSEESDYPAPLSTATSELNTDRQHPAFIQGLREMKDEDLQELSQQVVEGIRVFAASRNRPPFSIAEFLNEGILRDAIDAIPSINDRKDNFDRIPRYSPAHVNQGTLVGKIGEFAQVRSDTFTIRAFGADLPEDSPQSARMYCEAVVQRTNEEFDAPHARFGRRFEVISFRWIPEPPENL